MAFIAAAVAAIFGHASCDQFGLDGLQRPLQTIETELVAAGMTENSGNSSSDKSHKARRANITGITIIGRFFIFVIKPLLPRAKKTGE